MTEATMLRGAPRVLLRCLLALLLQGAASGGERTELKKLNVLMLSDFQMGHMANLLRVGEELSYRGHNVTMLVIPNEADQDKYRNIVEAVGAHFWSVRSEDLPQVNFSELSTKDSMIEKMSIVRLYYSTLSKVLAEHINGSLTAGDWDLVFADFFLTPFISCMHVTHRHLLFVLTASMCQHPPHCMPEWPWPSLLHGATSDDLSFFGRAFSAISPTITTTFMDLMFANLLHSISDYCPSLSIHQAFSNIGVNIPYVLATAIGFEFPRTIPPMMHYVGPLVPRTPAPLTAGLEQWLSGKPERSVVYISMGSVFALDRSTGQAFLEGVMDANYSLLWSLRKSNQWILEGLDVDPDRVLISEWTPQFSVLGSRTIHSAILHGGYNGIGEALWNGVPVLMLPQMIEQFCNAGRVRFNGLGILLDGNSLSSTKVSESLKALDAGEYRANIAKVQKIFHMAGGAKRVADLLELYADVGYAHLVPAYAKYQWSWVQYYNADVYALMMLLLALAVLCLVTCCKCICRRCCLKKLKGKEKKE